LFTEKGNGSQAVATPDEYVKECALLAHHVTKILKPFSKSNFPHPRFVKQVMNNVSKTFRLLVLILLLVTPALLLSLLPTV